MVKFFSLLAALAALLVAGDALAQYGGRYDATAIHKTGPQTMSGPLTLTCAACATVLDVSSLAPGGVALAIPAQTAICLDRTNCASGRLYSIGAGTVKLEATTLVGLIGPALLSSTADIRGAISNGAGNVTLDDTVDVSGTINSTVASGSDFMKSLDGARLNFSTADASSYLYRSGANIITAAGGFGVSLNLSVGGVLNLAGYVYNSGSTSGGKVAFNDDITGAYGANGSGGTPGGNGTAIIVQGGRGGDGTATAVAGQGALLTLKGGDGGVNNGGGGNHGGSLSLQGGAATGAGTNGTIAIGTTNTSAITLGSASATTTVSGPFVVGASYYMQFQANGAAAPAAGDCDADGERGRLYLETTNFRLYVCMGAARGWDYVALAN